MAAAAAATAVRPGSAPTNAAVTPITSTAAATSTSTDRPRPGPAAVRTTVARRSARLLGAVIVAVRPRSAATRTGASGATAGRRSRTAHFLLTTAAATASATTASLTSNNRP